MYCQNCSDNRKDICVIKIINSKKYDIKTARKLASYDNGLPGNDFNYCAEYLYKKKTGEFFLYGFGGAATKYSECVGERSWASGEDIIPLTVEEAKEWVLRNKSGDCYIEIFGDAEE